MEVDAEPINPQASDADTVGNLTYIEGDMLHVSAKPFKDTVRSL